MSNVVHAVCSVISYGCLCKTHENNLANQFPG